MQVAEGQVATSRGVDIPRSPSYEPFRRLLLSSTRIRELSTLRPARAIVDVLICWAWIVAAWALVAWHPTWWTVLLAIPVVGNRYYALFIVGHDGMHPRVFIGRRRNDFWTDLLVFSALGAVTHLHNRNHPAHHIYLSTTSDPDRHKHACFNKGEGASFPWFLSGLSSVWASAKSVFLPRGGSKASAGVIAEPPDRYNMRDVAILVMWFVALAGGLSMTIGWWAYPVLWLVPTYVFMYLADNARSFAEHSHPEGDGTADAHRLITYRSCVLERALIAPMNMNFHTV